MSEHRRNTAIVRILACVLCAFLIGASLDAIPDPPAVTQHAQHSLASQVDQNGTLPLAVVNGSLISYFSLLDRNPSNAYFLETALPPVGFVLVSYATDTSPPDVS
jgi:hypothetical protein